MKIGLIFSNHLTVGKNIKSGTGVFNYVLTNNLVKSGQDDLKLTAFTSGDSDLPAKIESIEYDSSEKDKSIKSNKIVIFELALISKAFSMQDDFDLFHINIGDGDIVLPFTPFVKKPILITLHYSPDAVYVDRYFSHFLNYDNLFFISISDAQRKLFPKLNFIKTIYHGIETDSFAFNETGGEKIMWAGRGVPEKGLNIVFDLLKRTKKEAKLFALTREEHVSWLKKVVSDNKSKINSKVEIEYDLDRPKLIDHYRLSKLFLFPIRWEEPFGLVLIESMACGTPIVAFARGSVPEIVKDGQTGFIVNPSDSDIRGDWIIKETGVKGLQKAVERIYSMEDSEYRKMRQNCRNHVEQNFTSERMAADYIKIYEKLSTNS